MSADREALLGDLVTWLNGRPYVDSAGRVTEGTGTDDVIGFELADGTECFLTIQEA